MSSQRDNGWSRRKFLGSVAFAGTGVLLGSPFDSLAVEPPPETTRIRLVHSRSTCQAPLLTAEELLRSEGFRLWIRVSRTTTTTLCSR